MITHVFHIADLHIRAGNTEQSRFTEYNNVFERFVQDVGSHPATRTGHAIIVVAGDVFHHKLRIESPGLKLALDFFQQLGALCPVYVIRGNHDFRQDKPHEPDLIQSLIHLKNIHYIDETGVYSIDDIGFGVVTVQDALQKGATVGIANQLPEFPSPKFEISVTHKIALFHGNTNGYPNDWFPTTYDVMMLGDIHVQQVYGCKLSPHIVHKPPNSHVTLQYMYPGDKSGMVYGYAGSMIQQDFGEGVMGHGYLLWDLDNKTVDCFHLKNDYGFVTTRFHVGKDVWEVQVKRTGSWQPLAALIHEPWFPRILSLRVVLSDGDGGQANVLLKNARDVFTGLGLTVSHVTSMTACPPGGATSIPLTTENQTDQVVSFNTPETWIEYVKDKVDKGMTTDLWQSWFTSPDTIQLPTCEYVANKVKDRNIKLDKKVKDYLAARDRRKISKSKFRFLYMSWDWILCFRDGNWFNFEDIVQHDITVVAAKNGIGKTSLLETLCIALYGEGFPSRTNKAFSASTLSLEKPKGDKAQTSLFVQLGNDTYRIHRVMAISTSDATKMVAVSKDTTIDRVEAYDKFVNIYSGKTAVDEWVDTHVGDIRSFLLSCMITQGGDYDFFNMKPADQKDLLDQALDMESCSLFQAVLKEAKTAHASLVELAEAHLAAKTINHICDQDTCIDAQIDVCQKQLFEKRFEQQGHAAALHGIDPLSFDGFVPSSDDMLKDDPMPEIDQTRSQLTQLLNVNNPSHYGSALSKLRQTCGLITIMQPTLPRDEIALGLATLHKHGFVPDKDDVDIIDDLQERLGPDYRHVSDSNDDVNIDLIYKYGKDITVVGLLDKINHHMASKPKEPSLSRQVAEQQASGPMPNAKGPKGCESLQELEVRTQLLNSRLVELLSSQPVKPQNIGIHLHIDRKTLERDIDETCSERDLDRLTKLISDLEQLHTKYLFVDDMIMEAMTMKKELEMHPYNPDCWACEQQPWKKQCDSFDVKISTYETELKALKKTIKKTSGCKDAKELKEYTETLKTHMRNIQMLHVFDWLEFKRELDTITQEQGVLSPCIVWLKWKEAHDAIKTWKRVDAWDTKKLDLDRDLGVLMRVEKMLLYRRVSCARMVLLQRDLDAWDSINNAKRLEQASELKNRLDELERRHHQNVITRAYTHYKARRELDEQVKMLEKEQVDLVVKKEMACEQSKTRDEVRVLEQYITLVRSRLNVLQSIHQIFDGFKTWVYTNKVIPYLTSFANNIIQVLCETRPIELVGKMMNGNPVWFLNDNTVPPIEKASGFQKFILGLAMRIALAKFGACGMLCSQLFIDEGFTACDSDNIGKVPTFLKYLLSMYPHGIVLVSHMDDVKACATYQIQLQRKPLDTTTLCCFGSQK